MTREEYLAYMREYNKGYKAKARWMRGSIDYKHDYTVLSIEPTQLNFKGTDQDEPIVCANFGCSKHLSETEKLASNFCINHQVKQKIDVAMRVSFPIQKAS